MSCDVPHLPRARGRSPIPVEQALTPVSTRTASHPPDYVFNPVHMLTCAAHLSQPGSSFSEFPFESAELDGHAKASSSDDFLPLFGLDSPFCAWVCDPHLLC